MNYNKRSLVRVFAIFFLVNLLSSCASVSPKNKSYMANLKEARVVLNSGVQVGYNGPSANISSALFYDYSDKSHLYENEIGAINQYLNQKKIDIRSIVRARFEIKVIEYLGIQVIDTSNSQNHPKFQINYIDFKFSTPHPLGKKVSPQFQLGIELIDESGMQIFEGPGLALAKFSGEGRQTLEDWLTNDELFISEVTESIDDSIDYFFKFYIKSSS